jgi:nitrate reductase gamma subunit
MQLVDDAMAEVARMLRAKTGFSAMLVVLAALVVVLSSLVVVFLCVAAYLWLALRYDSLTSALILGGAFFALAIVCAVAAILLRRRTMAQARAAPRPMWWADPTLMTIGLELGRSIGWRRLLPLAVAGMLAAGLARDRTRAGGE